ncbi:exodeoxyribonuclease V subunit gamma [Guyparkeria halophila]|uniref:exodeoxyribonuclease V subunit gamma n=1 Tax=Guyparkeria halophila TaxID=47960 RepID=UPI0018CBF334|nr:exodeoxyribonuclease V subunit gamma [Guyparkeria halophila]
MTDSTDAHAPITPGFIVLQGNRLEGLRDLLVEWLRRAPLGPLEDERILVQSNGMAQWLRLALGRSQHEDGRGGLGIATAMDLLLPARLQWQCYRAVLGRQNVPPEAPLDKARLTWRLLRLLRDPAIRADPVFDPLAHYIVDDEHRAYQLAARLSDQFDQYQVYRADWLERWANEELALPGPLGEAPDVPADSRWQPALWRAVLDDLVRHPPETEDSTAPADFAGRALVHRAFLDRAAQAIERPPDLPRRIVVFGVSALPPQVLEVLGAISRWTQVIFCLQNPCRHYWGDIVEDRHLFRHAYRRIRARKVDASLAEHDLHQHAHPLLASWGKQGRDLVRLVDAFDQAPERAQHSDPLNIDLFTEPTTDHLLGQIQADLLDLRPVSEMEAQGRRLDAADESLRFTIAHSPLREVEILQDQLLAAFDADPGLRPRDVIVMVPDMTDYAAAISAVFGRLDRRDPRYLPFAISDRPERDTHPMLRALESLLHLPEARLTASEVLDLLEVDALRARFGIADSEVATLRHWIDAAGIRWGLDGDHRPEFGLPAGIEQNTWHFGLDRLLYGYLAGADDDWQDIVPVGGMEGMSAAVIGPLHHLIDTIGRWRHRLSECRSPGEWATRFEELVEAFFDPDAIPPGEDDQANPLAARESAVTLRDRVLEAITGWLEDCRSAAFDQPIGIETARSAWLDRLDEHRLNQRFLVGAVNFATLMPMRAIPFRHVYLLGMSDEAYPRRQPAADFDLMAGRYRPGDRSRREDDRYLFLEALLSARDRFWISWVGRDIRDNQQRPASVLVNQLRDHIDRGWSLTDSPDETAASDSLTTEHPLQPFSRAYFGPERPELSSYATEWQQVHAGPNVTHTATSAQTEDEMDAPIPTLGDLAQLLKQPWRVYLGRHLGVAPRTEIRLPDDDEPFALDPLGESQLSAQLLELVRARLAREPVESLSGERLEAMLPEWIEAAFDRLAGTGQLPLAPFDEALRRDHADPLARQLTTWAAFQARYPDILPAVDIDARLTPDAGNDQDTVLSGQIDDIRVGEDQAVRLRLLPGALHKGKNLKWHRLVGEWPTHLAAQLSGRPVTTYLISESDAQRDSLLERPVAMEPVDPTAARDLLTALVGWWHQARRQPLPAEARTQIAWLTARDDLKRRSGARAAFDHAAQYDADLRRLWPEFAALEAHADFEAVANALYRPLLSGTRGEHRKALATEGMASEGEA